MSKLRKRKGFTLTELAVVIAIIAVLIAVLVPTFYTLIKNAKESSDSQLTKNMNEAVSIEDATSGIETPEDAIMAALSVGYSVENLSAKSEGNIIVYDQESTRFVLISEDLKTVVYKDSSTTKTGGDYGTATTWLFLETTNSDVVSTGTDFDYVIDGDNSYILIGSEWVGKTIQVKSASGIDTSQISGTGTQVETTYVSSSAAVSPALAKKAIAASGIAGTEYPIIYNVKSAHLTYKGGMIDVKIYGSYYVSLDISSTNSNTITVANTVSYVDVTGSASIKVDIQSGGSTKLIAYSSNVTVTNTSGTSLQVTIINEKYENGETPDSLVTDSDVYKTADTASKTIAPTCTEQGYTANYYVNKYTGDEVTVISNITNALGHTSGDAVTENEVAATCTTDGSHDTVHYCTVCGEEVSREAVTDAATGHTEVDTTSDPEVVPAIVNNTIVAQLTYTTTHVCSACGEATQEASYTTETKNISELSSDLLTTLYNDTETWKVGDWEISFTSNNCSTIYIEKYSGSGSNVVIPTNVTSVGGVFKNHTEITSITIPSTVTSIASSAFYGCTGLTSITIPSSVTSIGASAFYGCTSLATISLSNGLTTIGASAFAYCSDLTSIVVPDSVTTIGLGAFYGCSGLTSMTLPFVGGDANATTGSEVTLFSYIFGTTDSYLTAISDMHYTTQSYNSDTTIYSYMPDLSTVTITGSKLFAYAFSQMHSISSISVANVTEIPEYAFFNCSDNYVLVQGNTESTVYCTGLKSVSLGSITSIGDYAFYGCEFTTITLGSSLTTIGIDAFSECKKLTSITIPATVTSIGNRAFFNCTALTTIYYNAANAEVSATTGSYTNNANEIFELAGKSDNGITVTIGSTVEVIPAYLFHSTTTEANKPNIVKVTFANNSICTSIGESAFYGLSSLTALDLSKATKLTTIGSSAFEGSGLTSLNTYYVETIGASAFKNCNSLTTLTIGASLKTVNSNGLMCYYVTTLNYNNSNNITSQALKYIGYSVSGDVTVNIGEDVTAIGDSVFSGASNITSVNFLGTKVTTIGTTAFSSCSKLTSITIPASVTSISANAFSSCTSLANIYVADGNTAYKSVNGNLYSYNGTTLVRYAPGKTATSFTVADTVTTIGDYAFNYASNLTTVDTGSGVTTIGYLAFQVCSSLTSVTIGTNVTTISKNAFQGCSSLSSATFEDTNGWYCTTTANATRGTDLTLTDTSTNATYLKTTYMNNYYWYKSTT